MNLLSQKTSKAVLKSYIASRPKNGRGEVSRIAEHLGVSTTLVSQVLAGEKVWTPEQAQALTEYLGLAPMEADYFSFLVQYERAGTTALRKFWEAKLEELRDRSLTLANRVVIDRVLSDQEKAIFYSTPLYSSIRLFTSVGEKGKSLDEIVERFEIPRTKAATMLSFLVETGLCKEQEGRYFLGVQKTHLAEGSPHLLRHHANWRIRAIRQSEELSPKELMYTVPVSLSREDFDVLREEMVQFIKSFLERVHASPAQEIACFNMDFFWIRK